MRGHPATLLIHFTFCPYPGDGERHVEVLSALQSEAPWSGAIQSYCVRTHLQLNVNTPANNSCWLCGGFSSCSVCPSPQSTPQSLCPASVVASPSPSALGSLSAVPCLPTAHSTSTLGWWGWVGQVLWNLCDNIQRERDTQAHKYTQVHKST